VDPFALIDAWAADNRGDERWLSRFHRDVLTTFRRPLEVICDEKRAEQKMRNKVSFETAQN
jgi:hypothetical protein